MGCLAECPPMRLPTTNVHLLRSSSVEQPLPRDLEVVTNNTLSTSLTYFIGSPPLGSSRFLINYPSFPLSSKTRKTTLPNCNFIRKECPWVFVGKQITSWICPLFTFAFNWYSFVQLCSTHKYRTGISEIPVTWAAISPTYLDPRMITQVHLPPF